MSNTTDVLSFDDALSNHKKVLTESLVNFNEGQRVLKIMLDIDSNSADYEYSFQSGQQSKQAEIDDLKWMLKNSNGQDDDFCRRSIELQKLIDEARTCCEEGCVLKAMEILKGEETK